MKNSTRQNIFLFIIAILLGTKSIIMSSQLSTLKKTVNENLADQEYLKKPHPAKQEFEKYLPEGLRKDIGNIVQDYLYVDFKQWKENNEKLLDYAQKGDKKLIQELLESGDVDVNTQDPYGWTALLWAALEHEELVELLLEKGANINIQDQFGSTALMKAVSKNNKELVELLLKKGANINTQDKDGNTALMRAVSKNNKELVELLFKKGANINIQDQFGSTALMKAVSKNNKELVELLLKKGANINTQNKDGNTALMIAQREENKDIVEILNKNVPA